MAIQLKDLYNAYGNPDQAGNILLYSATQGRFGSPFTSSDSAVAPVSPDTVGFMQPASYDLMPRTDANVDYRFEPYQVAGLNNVPPPSRRDAVAQVAPVAANAAPVTANVAAPVAPEANVAAPAVSTVQPAPAPAPAPVAGPYDLLQNISQEKDPGKRYAGFQKLATDANIDEGTRKMAAAGMMESLTRQQDEARAMRELQNMSPNDLARVIKKDTNEGSFIKYFLASRLGLNELAAKEADKLGYTNTRSAEMLPSGEKYYVERRKDGTVVSAMDANGNYVPQDTLARLATEALPTRGAKAEVGVSTVVNTKTGEIGKVVTQQFGSQTRTFVESGGKIFPADANTWKPQTEVTQSNILREKLRETLKYVEPTKRMEKAAEFDQIEGTNFSKRLKEEFPEFFGAPSAAPAPAPVSPAPAPAPAPAPVAPAPAPAPAPVAPAPAPAPASRDQSMRIQPNVQAVRDQDRLGILNNELAQAQQQLRMATDPQQKQRLQGDVDAITREIALARRQAGPAPVVPVSPAPVVTGQTMGEIQRQREREKEAREEARKRREELFKSDVAVTEADRKDFVDYKNKTVQPAAQNGQTVSEIRREQISGPNGLLKNPTIIGIMQNQGSGYDEAKNLLRDMISGNFQDSDEVSKKIANLKLSQPEKDALYNFNMLNTRVNALTLKANSGPGAISDAEQRANRAANVDVARAPVIGAFTQLSRGQFMADMDLYKNDWLAQRPDIQTQAQFQKAWSAEERRLKDQYDAIYGKRAEYIGKHGSTPDAAVAGFRHYPQPMYNPQTKRWEITGYSAGATRPSLGSFVR